MIRLHNTLTRRLDDFTPLSSDKVTLYTCGPTVYDDLHVGNWAAYVYWDTLVRTLQIDGYTVDRVMNITDVGHLVSDGDEGEDKLEKGAKRDGISAWEVAKKYEEIFLTAMNELNIQTFDVMPRATEHIAEQIALVQHLEAKGYTYEVP